MTHGCEPETVTNIGERVLSGAVQGCRLPKI